MPLEEWIDKIDVPKPHDGIKNESDEDCEKTKNFVYGLIKEK